MAQRDDIPSAPSGPVRQPPPWQLDRSAGFHAIFGVCYSLIFVCLLVLDVILAAPGLTGNSLRAPLTAGGVAEVLVLAVVLTFIGVLWPVGFLSQAVFAFVLLARARRDPQSDAAAVDITPGLAYRGPTIDPVVQTPLTRRWTRIGDVGWLPNWQLLVGSFFVALALALLSAAPDWRFDGADMPALYAVIVAAAVIGLVGIVWGIRMRVLKVHAEAGAAAHRAELDHRNLVRDERRRAALTPAQRAAEDAMLASIDLSPRDDG